MANTKNKENSRSYDDIKKSIINKVEAIETNQNEIKDELNEAIKVLREQGKDKKLIIERLKNDFVLPNFVGKSTVYNVVNYAFASDEQKQKIENEKKAMLEKRKLMYQQVITGGGSTQLLEEGEGGSSTGLGNNDEEEEDDIHTQRQRAKDNQIVANVRKAGKQMQKMNPETIQGDAFNDDDDDEEESGTYNDDDDNTLSKARHEIVMDDQDILSKIATLLSESKTFTLIVDGNLKCLDVKEGITFS